MQLLNFAVQVGVFRGQRGQPLLESRDFLLIFAALLVEPLDSFGGLINIHWPLFNLAFSISGSSHSSFLHLP